MSETPYCPHKYDIIKLDFDPQAGREQAGRRPAIVLSKYEYNKRTKLSFVCPITRSKKGYPFEVDLPDGLLVTGVILSDHAKSLSWDGRNSTFICKAPDEIGEDVKAKLLALL